MQPNGLKPFDRDEDVARAAEGDPAAVERGLLADLDARIAELDAIAWNLPPRPAKRFPPDVAWPKVD